METGFSERAIHLINVAQGREKAHLAVLHGTIANVYSGEMLENQGICVWDRWIAYVGPNPDRAVGPETTVIDARGKTVIPGLIDSHTHLAGSLYAPDAFLRCVIPGGTTAVVTETAEPYTVLGHDGVADFMDAFADQPIHAFATAPPIASISPNFPPIPLDDLRRIMARTDMIGLGESYWQTVLGNPRGMLPLLETALSAGKRLEGHSAGAGDDKLNAYVAAGISSCHEPIQAEEALGRLRLGVYVMIREGSIRRDLEALAALRREGVDLRRLILVTDGVTPGELLERGYMDHVVQKAMGCGFSPMEAIQMATLNPATHFNLDHLIGGIAPGRYADLAILPDIRTLRPERVIAKGRVVAAEGRCLAAPRVHRFSGPSLDSVHLAAPLTADDFRIAGPRGAAEATVRVMDMVTDLVTREAHVALPVHDGEIRAEAARDILKVAALNRANAPGRRFTGLVRGFGIRAGAFACSTGWDAADIVVVGASEADMAAAVNRIHALKGGVAVCRGGAVTAELALPIMGLMSPLPLEELAKAIDAVNAAVHALGNAFRDPLLSLSTLTGAAIPFLRICEEGLVNLKTGPCPLIV